MLPRRRWISEGCRRKSKKAQTARRLFMALEEIAALQHVVASTPVTVEEAARSFSGARRDMVARHLETLTLMGELRVSPDGRYQMTA